MSAKYASHVSTKEIPQSEPVPGKPQVENNAGGFVFAVDDWKRLERFLVLGAEGTFYVAERKLTQDNAACVIRCAALDPKRTVETIVRISEEGRAPKNDPAVFALALCASLNSDDKVKNNQCRSYAYNAVHRVCRIGTHIFQFAAACDAMRGWGSGLRRAVGNWYTSQKDAEALGYQLAKYQQRDGWSHRDLLRLCHVKANGAGGYGTEAALRWATTGDTGGEMRTVTRGKGDKAVAKQYGGFTPSDLPRSIQALESLRKATDAKECERLLREFADKATREMVPTQFLSSPNVWAALLETMPMTAMLRNLATMTRVGLLAPLSDAVRTVCDRLRDRERLKKARVHPLSLLVALNTYKSGRSVKGDGVWAPVQNVCDALDEAFYLAFDAIEPTNKRWLLALDVSGSMASAQISGMPLTACEASVAMAMVTARTEANHHIVGFTAHGWGGAPSMHGASYPACLSPVAVSPRTRLDDAIRTVGAMPMGGTDCALPMLYAAEQKIPVDVFASVTDNETWAGKIHPFQALKQYRDKMGIPAKMIVVGMTSSEFTIADPSDGGSLDVCGFSTDVPAVMSDFVRN